MAKMRCYLVVLCILQTITAVTIENISRRTGNTRESRKLFGGYKITPKFCKPTRKVETDLGGPNICMFNHECVLRNGQVVGACMDGFLFGACCQIPSGVVGELMESDLQLVSHVNNNLPYKPLYTTRVPPSSLYTVNKLTVSNLPPSTHILPTAQDNGVYQVNGLQDQFSSAGVTHTSSSETFFLHQDVNDNIDPNEFKKKSSPAPLLETRKTTPRTEIMPTQYRPAIGTPIIQISISNPPEYYSTQKPFTYKKPGFKPKPTKPTEEKYVLIPTISHPVTKPNKTQEFDSIINIIQMLNESNTPATYATGSTYQYSLVSSTKQPQATPLLAETKQPPSTSYVYSSTPIPPRPTIATTKLISSSKPTHSSSLSPTSLYYYPGTSPYDYFYSSTMTPVSTVSTTKKPLSTSYVFSSTVSKRPTTNGLTPVYSMYPASSSSYPTYEQSSNTKYPTSTPTIIILGPGTTATAIKKPMAQLTINNHVTHNMMSTEMPMPTILITPKPGIASIKPVNPTTDYFTSGVESETSVNDLNNFPPVRNPNLNISASYLDDFTTPAFLEDDALNIKMESFVNKIAQSLQEPFNGLKEVVYNRNTTVFFDGSTKKTTKKPASTIKPFTNTKPFTSRKPTSTKKPTTSLVTKKTTSKKPTTPKKVITTTPTYIETETETPTAVTGDYSGVCGVRPLIKTGRIVGGKGAAFGGFPWQVLVRESTWLGLFTKNKCGGVLISNRYVMTAAHCQPGFLASLVAVFGEHDISGERETKRSLSRNVKRVIVHREYDATTFENDLALLELEHAVIFDEHIVPICLPREGEDFTGRMATVTGWGRLKYNGGVPSILQEVQVPIMENHVCQEMFRTANHHKVILDSFLCAGYANGQKDSCEGDSGGPLVLKRPDGRFQLAGTVSHGIKCAAPYLPGVYMRTAYYKPWIQSITGVQ